MLIIIFKHKPTTLILKNPNLKIFFFFFWGGGGGGGRGLDAGSGLAAKHMPLNYAKRGNILVTLTLCFDVTSTVCQQRSECKTLDSEETLK